MTDEHQQLTTQFLAGRHSLFAFIYGFVRNTHDAEDIFQEVWIRFSESLNRGVAIADQAKWCRGIARNLILHHWRDRQRAKVVVDQELIDLVEQAFEEQDAHPDYWQARQQALAECIQELPPKSRDILRMKYEEGLTADTAAGRLRQSAASVLMALSRLRRALRECAEKKMQTSGLGA